MQLSSTPGRRERKKRETRQRILEVAVALFSAQGYEATTMDEIAESADFARATVFNFFPRKSDLILAWFEDRRAELANRLAENEARAARTAPQLAFALHVIAGMFDQNPRTGRAMARAWLQAGGPLLAAESDTPRMFADTIRAGQVRGDVDSGIDADRAGLVLFDAYLGVLYRWASRDEQMAGFGSDLDATLDVLLTGISR
jgi:TetR/AcrR family transcriptional regulator, cholesterol catabolism regulator